MVSVRMGSLLAITLLGTLPVSAQYPWPAPAWGGLRIRTPFWNLDVNPYEGTSFQSPYGAFSASPGAYPPVPPAPPFPPFGPFGAPPYPFGSVQAARPIYPDLNSPNPQELAPQNTRPDLSIDQETLPQLLGQLAVNAEQLRRALERHPQGESWLKYLDPATVHQQATRAMATGALELSATERSHLESLLGHYRATLNSPEFRWVVSLPGYQETLQRLDRWLAGQANSAPTPETGIPQSTNPPPLPQPPASATAPQPPLSPQVEPRHPDSRLEQLPAPNPVSSRRGSI